MNARSISILVTAFLLLAGCDRNMQPYVPGEKPQQPDLSKIFPAGAEKAASRSAPSAMGGRGAAPVGAATGGAAPTGTTSAGTEPRGADSAGGRSIVGEIRVSPEVADSAPNGGVLFVIVRTGVAGPPTAVKRIVSPSFPLAFSIGPGDRMIESIPFDGPFQITARLDADGNAMTQDPGDLVGNVPDPVAPGTQGLDITLGRAK